MQRAHAVALAPLLKGLVEEAECDLNQKGTILAQRIYEAWSAAAQCVKVALDGDNVEAIFYYELCRLRCLDCKDHASYAHLVEVIGVLGMISSS